MVKMRENPLKLTFLVVLSVCSVLCNDSKFKSNFNIVEHLKRNFYAKSDLNITHVIGEFVSQNWTENHKCLNELNAIKNGIINFDEWAITRKLMSIFSQVEKSLQGGPFGSFSFGMKPIFIIRTE